MSCGEGNQTRKRFCDNPTPAHGGMNCTGNNEEIQACTESPCPDTIFISSIKSIKWIYFGVNLIWRLINFVKFAGHLVWRMADFRNFGRDEILANFYKIRQIKSKPKSHSNLYDQNSFD